MIKSWFFLYLQAKLQRFGNYRIRREARYLHWGGCYADLGPKKRGLRLNLERFCVRILLKIKKKSLHLNLERFLCFRSFFESVLIQKSISKVVKTWYFLYSAFWSAGHGGGAIAPLSALLYRVLCCWALCWQISNFGCRSNKKTRYFAFAILRITMQQKKHLLKLTWLRNCIVLETWWLNWNWCSQTLETNKAENWQKLNNSQPQLKIYCFL